MENPRPTDLGTNSRQEEATSAPSRMVLPVPVHGQVQVMIVPVDTAVYVTRQLPPLPAASVTCDMVELTRHLPNSILDRPCEDIPLTDIAREMTMYHTIYTYLHISRPKNEDIMARYPHSPERQRQELLFEWRDENGMRRATYRELIKCFCDAKREDLVILTCRILESHHPEATASPADTTLVDSPADTTLVDTPADTTLGDSPADTTLAASPGNTTLVASPDGREEKTSFERTALVRPQRSPSQDPAPAIPFQKQWSRLQSPGTEPTSTPATCTGAPAILTTMLSYSSSASEDQSNLNIFLQPELEAPQSPVESPASTEFLLPEVQRSHSGSSSVDSFHTAHTHSSTQSLDDLSDGDVDSMTADDIGKQLDRITSKCKDQLVKKEKKVQDLKQQLKVKDEKLAEAKEEIKDLKGRLAEREQELASRLSSSSPDSELLKSERDQLRKEVQIFNESLLELERERKEVAEECAEANSKLGTCRERNRGLREEILALKREQCHSRQESRTTIMQLSQRVKYLEGYVERFFSNSSCRQRRHSAST